MRKMKKINGYLVVKFNARELREYEGTALGEYGVIDAELYTGILDVDRGAMEYRRPCCSYCSVPLGCFRFVRI